MGLRTSIAEGQSTFKAPTISILGSNHLVLVLIRLGKLEAAVTAMPLLSPDRIS